MLKYLSLWVLILSTKGFAEVSALDKLEIIAQTLYRIGDDNNYVSTERIARNQFNTLKSTEIYINNQNNNALNTALQNCVFMAQGAYGRHLTEDLQDRIINQLSLSIMRAKRMHTIRIYVLEDDQITIGTGIDNARCLVALEEVDKHEVLLLQSSIMD